MQNSPTWAPPTGFTPVILGNAVHALPHTLRGNERSAKSTLQSYGEFRSWATGRNRKCIPEVELTQGWLSADWKPATHAPGSQPGAFCCTGGDSCAPESTHVNTKKPIRRWVQLLMKLHSARVAPRPSALLVLLCSSVPLNGLAPRIARLCEWGLCTACTAFDR